MRAAKAAQGRKLSRKRILRVKLVSLGDAAVGKSCVIKRCGAGRAARGERGEAGRSRRLRCPRALATAVSLLAPHAHVQPPASPPPPACCALPACCGPPPPSRYCEDKFISKYIPTIGVDYGVKPLALGDHEVRRPPRSVLLPSQRRAQPDCCRRMRGHC